MKPPGSTAALRGHTALLTGATPGRLGGTDHDVETVRLHGLFMALEVDAELNAGILDQVEQGIDVARCLTVGNAEYLITAMARSTGLGRQIGSLAVQ